MVDQNRELVVEHLEFVEKKDHYGLLGVAREATKDEIQAAYLGLVKRFHPDRFKDKEVAAAASRVFQALTQAWGTLSDTDKRSAYDRERFGKGIAVPRLEADPRVEAELERLLVTPASALGPRRVDAAKMLHHRGAMLFNRRDYAKAERYLRRALELDDTVPEHCLRLGWTLFNNRALPEETRHREARMYIERGVAMDPYSSDGRYSMACYWREIGQPVQYRRELEAAIRGKPKHPRAEQELAALIAKETRAAEAAQRYEQMKSEKKRFDLKRLFLGRE